ncbi:transporter substrate-binding protein [Rhizobium sp. Root1204]|uniref:transporter substrate-binding protein n=1 Tax=Rhizobium sp. Root1204 TaxID=1736428 RepID=UPI0007147687|nr:transporter substrate-binding protein [Rhizobium sp. Root1204]KQV41332.1 urea ABC transporter [Rhizobium sp. Root1204]
MKNNEVARRTFLKSSAFLASTLAMPYIARPAFAADTIRIGNLIDLTGPIGAGGQVVMPGMTLAVKEINESGLLGKQVEIVNYDAQSNMQLYTQYAQQLALKDNVDAVFGGLTSASREAIRPIFSRFKKLYFYNCLYEGGVCDRNIFCTGTTPAQTVGKLVPEAMKKWGKKVYIIAADYNYGQITAKWMAKFVKDNGGTVMNTDFFPLDVTNFSSAIARIQSASPDIVFSAMVGANHLGFYRQWESAGLKQRIPIASTTFGANSEVLTLDTSTTEGIMSSFGYYDTVNTPGSKAFVEAVKPTVPSGSQATELTACAYEAVNLWAQAVQAAGTTDRMKVIEALEGGRSFGGPSGHVAIDPKTHHTVRSAFIAEAKAGKWAIEASYADQPPADTAAVCDLAAAPNTNKQFVIEVN